MIANKFLDTVGIDTLYKAVRARRRREQRERNFNDDE